MKQFKTQGIMLHYNVTPVTNKPKRVTRNVADAIDHIITDCLLQQRGVFQVDLEGGRSISVIS